MDLCIDNTDCLHKCNAVYKVRICTNTNDMEIYAMTPFSSILEFYMKEKSIKTYSIAQFCEMDRSNMYKIINGKRNPPSEEIVEKIAEYMRLMPTERSRLMEAYQITIMGYHTYHRRKSVQDFLVSFCADYAKPEEKQIWQECVTVNEQELILWQGTVVKDQQLKHLISSVLNIEAQRMGGRICLIMQPEDNPIMDLLVSAGIRSANLCIEHIFCLSNTNDIVSEKKDYNLYCLKNILPMFIQCVCSYQPYCYYDNIVSHNTRFNLLSSMLLTSEYAIIFSMEEDYGMLLSDKDTVQHLHRLFQSLKDDTSLMADKVNSLERQLTAFETVNFSDKGVGFQPEACLLPVIPTAFLEKYLNRDLLSQEPVKKRVYQYIRQSQQIQEETKSIFIFTENGIRRFVDNGRISELPDSVYDPLEYKDRLLLLQKLVKECEKGRYQMMRCDAPIADVDICLYSAVQDGYLLIPTTRNDRIFLKIKESGLLNTFRDYFESLDRKYFYSEDETVNILEELLKKPH